MLKVFIPALVVAIAIVGFCVAGCTSIPKGVKPVTPFSEQKYLGKWYEIARMDYSFERHLNNVTAEYSLKPNGMIKVDNKGYDYRKNKWKQSIGKAKFAGDNNTGALKVSFFGPFYAGYYVTALDDQYKYAMVAGDKLKYLWILSREKTIPENIKTQYLALAKKIGFDTNALIWVKQD